MKFKNKLPEVTKTAHILDLKFTYFSYVLKPKPSITREFRRKMIDNVKELSNVSKNCKQIDKMIGKDISIQFL